MIRYLLFVLLFTAPCAFAAELPGIPQFIDEMVSRYQFNKDKLKQIFKRAERQQSVIDALSRPATLKPWIAYRASFVNNQRIAGGLQFWQLHANTLKQAEIRYGVAPEIIVALIGVETRYGLNVGKYSTLDALTTLAFDYPRRSEFFRSELEQFLLLAREQDFELFKVQGSYAGALGIAQFMPSSYRKYAVDFNGDGKIDLLHDPVDAIGSVANYLLQYGWIKDSPVAVRVRAFELNPVSSLVETHTVSEWITSGVKPEKEMISNTPARLISFTLSEGTEYWLALANFEVLRRYNNSDYYSMSVFQLAEALRAAYVPH